MEEKEGRGLTTKRLVGSAIAEMRLPQGIFGWLCAWCITQWVFAGQRK